MDDNEKPIDRALDLGLELKIWIPLVAVAVVSVLIAVQTLAGERRWYVKVLGTAACLAAAAVAVLLVGWRLRRFVRRERPRS